MHVMHLFFQFFTLAHLYGYHNPFAYTYAMHELVHRIFVCAVRVRDDTGLLQECGQNEADYHGAKTVMGGGGGGVLLLLSSGRLV